MSKYLSPLLIVLVILAVLAGSVYLYLKIFRGVPDPKEPGLPTTSKAPVEPLPPPPPSLVLPDLEESDEFLRSLVGEVSSHPRLMAWMVNDNLVRRFVTFVDNTAHDESPRVHVPFIELEGGFEVEERDGRQVIAESSFRRYDFLAAVVSSLDNAGAVQLFRDLEPLFEEAYSELGNPDSFEDALLKALDRVIAVDVPADPIEVQPRLSSYGFADPDLEEAGPVEKHLLRMGPRNAREIRTKLLTLKTALLLSEPGG